MTQTALKNKEYVKVRKGEYLKLKDLEKRFEGFFKYVEHLRDIKEAREDIAAGRVIPQEKLFKKLGLQFVTAVAAGYFAWKNVKNTKITPVHWNMNAVQLTAPSSTDTINRIGTSSTADLSNLVLSSVEGWKTYKNQKYGFEFRYPPGFTFGKYLFFIHHVSNTEGDKLRNHVGFLEYDQQKKLLSEILSTFKFVEQ